MEFCQSPPIFLVNSASASASAATDVEWDEPVFSDNSGDKLRVSRTHEFGTFPLGSTGVGYTATDSSGNVAVCNMTVRVQGEVWSGGGGVAHMGSGVE